MAFFDDMIKTAELLKAVSESFENDLRTGLKEELMRLAEERIDFLIDETISKLQIRINGLRDPYMMQDLIKITVNRIPNGA